MQHQVVDTNNLSIFFSMHEIHASALIRPFGDLGATYRRVYGLFVNSFFMAISKIPSEDSFQLPLFNEQAQSGKMQSSRQVDETTSGPMQLCLPDGEMLVLSHHFRLPSSALAGKAANLVPGYKCRPLRDITTGFPALAIKRFH